MNAAFYTGVSGMTAFQRDIDGVANNMANINTVGYKPIRSSFSDILYTQMGTSAADDCLLGHGVKVDSYVSQFSQGMINQTGNPLDFALSGNAFFCVEGKNRNPEYTRNGAFTISMENGEGYLVTRDGRYVLDDSGERIVLDKIDDTDTLDLPSIQKKIGVYTFANTFGLVLSGEGNFLKTAFSGEANAINNERESGTYLLISGALEFSAVDLSSEMANIIQSQRAFQLNAKIVQTADQIEEIINNLR